MTARWKNTLWSVGLLVASIVQAGLGFIIAEGFQTIASLSPADNLQAFAGLGLAMTGVLTAWLSRRPGDAMEQDRRGSRDLR